MASRATMIANALRPKQAESAPDVFSAPKQSWADYVGAQPATGYEGMPAPQPEGMPEYDPNGTVSRIAGALATMPTVQSIKSGLTLPGDVYAGRQPMGLPSETEDLSRVADLFGLVGTGSAARAAVSKPGSGAEFGVFGGRGAKTANHEALAVAETLAQKGAEPKAIWDQTGWFKGADDKWRFEIPDNTAKAGREVMQPSTRNPEVFEGRLAEAVQHPEFSAAYPDLNDMRVATHLNAPNAFSSDGISLSTDVPSNRALLAQGSRLTAEKGIPLGELPRYDFAGDIATDPSRLGIALHEMQHGLQQQEGFARGANPEAFAGDSAAMFAKTYAKASKAANRVQLLNEDPITAANFIAKHEGGDPQQILYLIEKHSADELNALWQENLPHTRYRRHAGEVEARNVETRRSMTPEERQSRPPWETEDVPRDQQIVRMRSEDPQMSIEPPPGGLLGNREPIRAYHGSPTNPEGLRYPEYPGADPYAGIRVERPIIGYHGSPHDFPVEQIGDATYPLGRFRLDKIGTGEGAQAYGHGLYKAENEGVAKSYRDTLKDVRGKLPDDIISLPPEMRQAITAHARSDADPLTAAKRAQYMSAPLREMPLPQVQDMIERFRDAKAGRMYEVAIHADPERFLNWDKPLSGHAKPVQEAMESIPADMYAKWRESGAWPHVKGETLYRELAGGLTRGAHDAGLHVGASQQLADAGIPGIKYLDQGSRAAGDGSRNYVLFDDKIIEILRKYGVGSIAALPPSVQMAIQLYQDQTQAEPQEPTFAGKASKMINDLQRKLRGPEPPATPHGMGIRG